MSKQTDLINVTDAITVDGSNNVGIGTSSPDDVLHVVTPSFGGITLECTGATADPTFKFLGDSGNYWSLQQDASQGDSFQFRYNNSEKIRIDSSGRVTMPYQPAFKVRTNYSSHTAIPNVSPDWSVVDHNTGNHFNVTTNAFTAPVSGHYLFSAHALISMAGSYAHFAIKVNGNRVGIVHSPNGVITSSYMDLSLTEVLKLNANDSVTIIANTPASNRWYSSTTYNSFSGYLLG